MNNFKNRNNLPYMNNGKWYRFFVESDGASYTLTTSDIPGAEIDGTILKLPAGYQIVDFKIDVHSTATDTYIPITELFANNQHGVQLPTNSTFDYLTLYIFSHKE